MRRIVVVGGGYAGFYAAWTKLRGEADLIVIDPRPYMTYQPFLPEVRSGSVEARYAAVCCRETSAGPESSLVRSRLSSTPAGW